MAIGCVWTEAHYSEQKAMVVDIAPYGSENFQVVDLFYWHSIFFLIIVLKWSDLPISHLPRIDGCLDYGFRNLITSWQRVGQFDFWSTHEKCLGQYEACRYTVVGVILVLVKTCSSRFLWSGSSITHSHIQMSLSIWRLEIVGVIMVLVELVWAGSCGWAMRSLQTFN